MYGYESWTINNAEPKELMPLNCGAGEDPWKFLGLQGDQTSQSSRKSTLQYSLEGLTLKFQYFGHLMQRATDGKRPWCWERLRAGREGGNRGWDGWMASSTQCIWVWANSRRSWRTGRPGMLQSMGSQWVRHELATEQQKEEDVYLFDLDLTESTDPRYTTAKFWGGQWSKHHDSFHYHKVQYSSSSL